jgi:hypothetical protein
MPGNFNTLNNEDGATVSTKASDRSGLLAINEGTPPVPPATTPAEPPPGSPGGAGVLGVTHVPAGAGVFGANESVLEPSARHRRGVGVQGNGPEAGVSGFSDEGNGLRGFTSSREHAAVFGSSKDSVGVHGRSMLSSGVTGSTEDDVKPAIWGANQAREISTNLNADLLDRRDGVGVLGTTTRPGAAGVYGENDSTYVWDDKIRGVGVYGRGPEAGINGFSDSGYGALAQSQTGTGAVCTSAWGIGLSAFSDNDIGIYSKGAKWSGVFNGAFVVNKGPNPPAGSDIPNGCVVITEGDLHLNNGNIFVHKGGDVILSGADCAEDFNLATETGRAPGTVMVLDDDGALRACDRPCDKRVVGVISGAGCYRTGLILDRQPAQEQRVPIALIGKVYCKVDAQYGAIEAGDLLTTSTTLGHAMKVTDPINTLGAVIGKALHPFRSGCGLVAIVVALR